MSKEEYLKQLQKYLKKLPKQDYGDAMEYFIEYFEETDEAGAQELMKELGTPKEAARDLISNLLDKKIEEQEPVFGVEDKKVEKDKKQSKWNIFWIALLAIFAAPIGAPLVFSALVVLLSLVLCAGILVLCVFIFGLSFFLVAGKLVIRGILAIPYSISGFALISGSGIFFVGLAILSVILGIYLAKWFGLLFVKLAQWISKHSKKSKQGGKSHE